MSEGETVVGILLAHGEMARGLVDAVRKISGADEEVLVPLSNEGRSPEALREDLEALISESRRVVFTDLASGSCALAARKCSPTDCIPVIVSGVNLPLLLDFVFSRHLPLEELIPHLLKRGISAIRSVPEFPEHVDSPVSG